MVIDQRGGKYVILYIGKSYFVGKDIITSVKREVGSDKVNNEVQLSVSPNPFNNSTIFSFSLPQQAQIQISMYDINGRKVQEIQNYSANSGENKITLNTNNLASGVYAITLQHNNVTYSVKALLVK